MLVPGTHLVICYYMHYIYAIYIIICIIYYYMLLYALQNDHHKKSNYNLSQYKDINIDHILSAQ